MSHNFNWSYSYGKRYPHLEAKCSQSICEIKMTSSKEAIPAKWIKLNDEQI